MSKLTMASLFDGSGAFPLSSMMCGFTPVWSSEIEPFPLRVTEARLPFVKHYGNVSEIHGDKVERVDLITFGSPCFLAGTKILTSSGMKNIEEVKEGDVVYTGNSWQKVTETMTRTSDRVHHLKATGTLDMYVTENHPMYVSHSKRCGHDGRREFSRPEWIAVKDIQKGDCLCMPIMADDEEPFDVTDEELWLMGRYVADGYVNNSQRSGRPEGQRNHKVIFCIGYAKEGEFVKHVNTYHVCRKIERAVVKCELTDERLMNLCLMCGRGAANKFIPKEILGLPKDKIRIFIEGYVSGDGCFLKNKREYSCTTISQNLALTLQMAVHKAYRVPCRIGKCNVPSTKYIEGRLVNQNPFYMVKWADAIKRQNHIKIANGLVNCPITVNLPISGVSQVYNLEVENEHRYVSNGVIAHNCQDLSVAGKRKGLKHSELDDDETTRSGLFMEAVRIAKEMRDERNYRANEHLRYPRWMVWENVPGAFSSQNGDDFRCVLEELARVKDSSVSIPVPESGKWATAGAIHGETWSIAWRTVDAQYFGVPQRRRRIYLVADFDDNGRGGGFRDTL